jgi:MtN3 and saliva related transmembrane protein
VVSIVRCHESHTEPADKVPSDRFVDNWGMPAPIPPALINVIGTSAAVVTTVCWVPQVLKIVRDREARAISLSGTLLCVAGFLLWLIYGLAIADVPLIGSSAVTLVITAAILALKIRHG